jgi:hypothetical protein
MEDTMKHFYRMICLALVTLLLSACSSTTFTSTWKDPEARTGVFQGKKVAAFVLAKDTAVRHAGEDVLAAELTKLGMVGIAGYTLVPDTSDEAAAKALLEKTEVVGVVTMRPVASEKELVSTTTYSGGYYGGPGYGGYWGGYYGYGWGGAYPQQETHTNTIVSVESLVYSLPMNKILWGGMTKTTNPSKVDKFIKEIVAEALKEMQKEGGL